MTFFEEKGVELQYNSMSRFQAETRFDRSCNICCLSGRHLECERCAIAAAHKTMNEIFGSNLIPQIKIAVPVVN